MTSELAKAQMTHLDQQIKNNRRQSETHHNDRSGPSTVSWSTTDKSSLTQYLFTAVYLDESGEVLAREDAPHTVGYADRALEHVWMCNEHPKADYIDFVEIF